MKPELTQPEYAYPTSPEPLIAEVERVQPANAAMLPPPAAESEEQWRQIGEQISRFWPQLPDDISRFSSNYKQPLTTVVLQKQEQQVVG